MLTVRSRPHQEKRGINVSHPCHDIFPNVPKVRRKIGPDSRVCLYSNRPRVESGVSGIPAVTHPRNGNLGTGCAALVSLGDDVKDDTGQRRTLPVPKKTPIRTRLCHTQADTHGVVLSLSHSLFLPFSLSLSLIFSLSLLATCVV